MFPHCGVPRKNDRYENVMMYFISIECMNISLECGPCIDYCDGFHLSASYCKMNDSIMEQGN